jgi:hypothetical protein
MKSVLRVVLGLVWMGGLIAAGGSAGVWYGNHTLEHTGGLVGAGKRAANLQDMFIGGMATGLVAALIGLGLFTVITSRSGQAAVSDSDGMEPQSETAREI